jgi:hypothetical protein
MLEEDDTIVRKCKRDAIDNAERVASTTTPLLAQTEAFTTTTMPANSDSSSESFFSTYKIPIIILAIVILILLGYISYVSMSGNDLK